ncbi:MAG: HAMP domain-containing sensor histidine kinase [Gallionella sp.]|nr:HAMP domain-containing sensor histidine kinase [Gallionella sp.]
MKRTEVKNSEFESSFLPMVSHDIKSLTNAIMGAAQSLAEKLNDSGVQDEQYIRECVQLIRCASSCVSPLIEDLVAIGKLQSDSSVINPVAVYHLRQELECARDTFSYEALSRQIQLSLFVEEGLPVVYWDVDSLRIHAINNILSNSIRFTPPGGKIAISVEKSDDNMIVIKISDSGLGIPASERESIFRKHMKSRHLAGNKRGVGLYNAMRCIQAHNGTISLVDEPDFSGATFKIRIPLYTQCMQ